MSADLNMSISMRGTQEELTAMLQVLKLYATTKHDQYTAKRNCAFLTSVEITCPRPSCYLQWASDEEISELVAKTGCGELTATAGGPYGYYGEVREIGLFEAMADAAPGAWFQCSISGFVGSLDVFHSAELEYGLLMVRASNTDEDPINLYAKDFMKKFSNSEFCELFEVDEEECDEDVYTEFISAAADQGIFNFLDEDSLFYDSFSELFSEYFEDFEADEDMIETFRQRLCDLGIESYQEFSITADFSDPTKSYTYDPSSGETIFDIVSCDKDDDDDSDLG